MGKISVVNGFNCSPYIIKEGLLFLFLYIFAVDGGEVGFH